MTDRFVARNAPLRLIFLISISIVFVALGLWIAGSFGAPPRPGREWLGWFAAAFFGLCALAGARRLFDNGDQIVVDRNGIFWRQWSAMTIPWGAISRFEHRTVRNQHFVAIHLKDPSLFPRDGAARLLGGLNRGMGFGDLAISAVGTDKSFAQLLAAVEHFAPPGSDGPAARDRPVPSL